MSNIRNYRHVSRHGSWDTPSLSWPAFLFTILWMLSKKLWAVAVIWILCVFLWSGAVVFMNPMNSEPKAGAPLVTSGGFLALLLVPGFKGNSK